jgi:hypothetical protein
MTRSSPSAVSAALTRPMAARWRWALAGIAAVVAGNAVGGVAHALGRALGRARVRRGDEDVDRPAGRADRLPQPAAAAYRRNGTGRRPGRTAMAMPASSEVPAAPDRGGHTSGSFVDLYWLPLGAGGHSVRINGLVYEAVAARGGGRERCDLYHSALEVRDDQERYVIEMAPVWSERAGDHGVVGEGAVGSRLLGGLRAFRYEIRRWPDGRIPDAADAVDSPQRLTDDPAVARRVLELVPMIPRLVWGRDEARTGDMWNSNSITAWLLVRSAIDADLVHVPAGGRAPGWDAGVALAKRPSARERGSPMLRPIPTLAPASQPSPLDATGRPRRARSAPAAR